MDRRVFLKSAAATATLGPQWIASRSFGQDRRPPPSERITLGHIGVGGRGSALLKNFLEKPNAQCVAVCDPFRSRREERKAEIEALYTDTYGKGSYKGCDAYNDFRELLAREDIDAVVVATPDHWHVPVALEAVRAGKDLYVEKPLGVSVDQDLALRKAIEEKGTVFQFGTQQRSEGNFRFACELVRNGRIGDLQEIEVWAPQGGMGGSTEKVPVPEGFDYDLWLGPAPEAPYTEDRCLARGGYWIYDYSLGFIAGWAVHPLDIAQWGADADKTSPTEYEGSGAIAFGGLYNTIMTWDMRCRYANGVEIHLMSSDVAAPLIEKYRPPKEHGTTFFGSEGWVSVDREGIYAEPDSLLKSTLGPDDIHLYESRDHRTNFLDCVKSRSDTICPIGSAVRVDTISQLCDIAIRLSRKIEWDPKNEKVVGDAEAESMLTRPTRTPWTL
jgi:hypothetical protein